MAQTNVYYRETRFRIEDDRTDVFVLVEADDGGAWNGWHHKSFKPEVAVTDILTMWADGVENPLEWPHKDPRQ